MATDQQIAKGRVLLALLIMLAGVTAAFLWPTEYTCAGVSAPEGEPCELGKIELGPQDPDVIVTADDRLPLRFGITVAAFGVGAAILLGWVSMKPRVPSHRTPTSTG
jgi:hypothetical protein